MATPYECQQYGRNLIWPRPAFEIVGGQTLSANTTLTFDSPRLNYLNASGGAFIVTLPSTSYEGATWYFSENAGSGNSVTISGNGLLINGASSLLLNGAWRQRTLRFNGTQYVVLEGIN